MKKTAKFLTLLLFISLVFVSTAFAVNSENEAAIVDRVSVMDGVSRICEDFEGESFSIQNRLTQETDGVKISRGKVPSAAAKDTAVKFGHYRSLTDKNGKNTFADWRFYEASEKINTNSDAYVALGQWSYSVSDLSYQILEFDMSTMTSYPSNLWIFSEWRDSNSGGKRRFAFGSYNDADGLWHFGERTLKIEKNEWVHVTIVIAIACEDDGTNADYTASVGRIFINGELMNEIAPYQNAVISSSLSLRQHYLGIGWPYGSEGARPGMDANSSVAVDNISLTKCQKEIYKGEIAEIFADDFTNLSEYDGAEIVYGDDYLLPSSEMASATVSYSGKTVDFDSAQAAVDFVRSEELEDALVRLYGDVYYELTVDAPLTLDLNGYCVFGDIEVTDRVYLHSVDGDLWQLASTSVFYANFEIFHAPYEKREKAEATLLLSLDESYTLPEPRVYVDPVNGDRYEPVGNWILYDDSGKVVEGGISKITEKHIGKHYVLCPEYTSPSVYFTVIDRSGKMVHYEDPAQLKGSNIPEGATVVLKRDIPYTNTVNAKNYSFDFNGYTVYCVDGAKPELFTGSGTVYIYSSRPGARVYSGSYMPNGNKDADGNPIYSNQVAFFLTDDGAASGTSYMVGYKDASTPSPYRIEAYTAAFIQLTRASDVSVYLCRLDVICNATDNKGILTTRNGGPKNRYWQIDDCDFIISNSKALCSNVYTGTNPGTYVFNHSRIFGNGKLLGHESKANGAVLSDYSVTLNSTSVYGTHSVNPGSFTVSVSESGTTVEKTFNAYVYITGECYLTSVSEKGCILEKGYMLIPTVKIGSAAVFEAPNNARYVNLALGNTQFIGGNYSAKGYVGKIHEYTNGIRQSVAIDSSVNVLFFFPKSDTLTGVYLGGENILNVNDCRMIDGTNCYVIRIATPPKDAYASREITLTFRATEETVTMDASLMHYAENLFAIEDTEEYADYFADSQALMRYVLYYVRTAAKRLGGVSDSALAEIDGYLGSFALSSLDKAITETVYKTTSATGALDAATLDLESKVGIVFRVSKGFVGTITVSMTGVKSEVRTYTSEAPAAANEYIILKNIPAHLLRSDVSVSIVKADSSQSTISYNLATYVSGVKTDIAYAVYAYAKQASSYRAKYPTASAFGD